MRLANLVRIQRLIKINSPYAIIRRNYQRMVLRNIIFLPG
jgi:hypothetical protein